jgi:hypothetical protein
MDSAIHIPAVSGRRAPPVSHALQQARSEEDVRDPGNSVNPYPVTRLRAELGHRGSACRLSSRQPPTRSLATRSLVMISRNMAISTGAVTASPYRMATVQPVLLAWPPAMIPSEPGTMPRRRRMQPSRTKQGRVGALDGLGNLRVGGVDQLAHLAAEGVLPAGQGIDTGTDARVGGVCHRASAPCQHRQGQASRTPWPVANRWRMVAGNTSTLPTSRRAIRQP